MAPCQLNGNSCKIMIPKNPPNLKKNSFYAACIQVLYLLNYFLFSRKDSISINMVGREITPTEIGKHAKLIKCKFSIIL